MDRRDAAADDLRALADDLKSLYESVTTDPKERRRKELQWAALQTTLGVLTTLVARRLVVKAWGILTGEQAPQRPPTEKVKHPEPPAEPAPAATPPDPLTQVMSQSEAETMSSSSSSVK